MLRISKLADYGTVVMVYLAKRAPAVCNARDIAANTHLQLPTVSKLLKRLTGAGLLVSVRGVSGGYRMKKMAAEISVAQMIHALEDSRGLTECSMEPNVCSLHSVCHVERHWRLISQAIESALDEVSLADLTKPIKPSLDFESVKQLGRAIRSGVLSD